MLVVEREQNLSMSAELVRVNGFGCCLTEVGHYQRACVVHSGNRKAQRFRSRCSEPYLVRPHRTMSESTMP